MSTQMLIVTRMIMWMVDYVEDAKVEANAAVEWEKDNFYAHGWCCNDCIIDQCGVNNLPYIGIEPALA